MSKLQIIVNGKMGEVTELQAGVTHIGRGDGNFILLKTGASSKKHARIEFVDSDWIVTDLGSRNGTHVNNVRIERHPLRHGDVIDFGGTRYKFLTEPDNDSSIGFGSDGILVPHKVMSSIPPFLDDNLSIRRSTVRTGDLVCSSELKEGPDIDEARVIAALNVHNLPLASWDYIESARKLSHVLRLTQAIVTYQEHQQIEKVLRVFLDLFAAASSSVLALAHDLTEGCRIVAAVSRQDGDPVYLCHPLLRRSMAKSEGLLVTDHWRNEANDRPKLTELTQQSLLCVAVPGADGSCQGVIQLQASDPGSPFSVSDLERLAVLAHVVSVSISGFPISS